jgi:hypothetical protein
LHRAELPRGSPALTSGDGNANGVEFHEPVGPKRPAFKQEEKMTKKRTSTRKRAPRSAQPQEPAQSTLKAEDEAPVQNTLTVGDRADAQDASRPDVMGIAGQQNLDLGSILGGLMGGASPSSSPPAGGMMGGGLLGSLIGPLVDDVARKFGIPRELAMLGAMFLVNKLLGGSSSQQLPPQMPGSAGQPGQVPGEIDLGTILGGLLGGMVGASPTGSSGAGSPPAGGDEVLGRIGQAATGADQPQQPGQAGGILIQGLIASNAGKLRNDGNLVGEFAQFAGVDAETAERSLNALFEAVSGRQE